MHAFGGISIGSTGGVLPGQLKVQDDGITWQRSGGDRTIVIKKEDMKELSWTRVVKGCQLGVRSEEGPIINFLGFRDQDYDELREFCMGAYSLDVVQKQQCVNGRNWGELEQNGASISFTMDGNPSFHLPLTDVSQVQNMKDEVMLEFHADDTAANERDDRLVEISFHVPQTEEYLETEEGAAPPPEAHPAKALYESILQHTDMGAGSGDEEIILFDTVAIAVPRGRFDISLHSGFMDLSGQTNDFRIRYSSIARLFVLPKTSTAHTMVIIALDPPIRKGQTYYPHIITQFENDSEMEADLTLSEQQLETINQKHGGKLHSSYRGKTFECFAKAVRGLCGAKITKPGTFRGQDGVSACVRCNYKADDGFLYPLERSFFYVGKPALLISHEDISSMEFQRQGGVLGASAKTFDLAITTRSGAVGGGVEYVFRGIARDEYHPVLKFIEEKRLRIENIDAVRHAPMAARMAAFDVGEDVDVGRANIDAQAESSASMSSDDEAFSDANNSDGSSSDSDEGDSDADAEMVDEEGISAGAVLHHVAPGDEAKAFSRMDAAGASGSGSGAGPSDHKEKKPKKEPKEKKVREPKRPADGGEKPAKKPKKKKDPNAPKQNMTPYFFFSTSIRPKIKEEQPGLAFGEYAKIIGARWKEMTEEDKKPYVEQAEKDKERYAVEKAAYQAKLAGEAAELKEEEKVKTEE